MRLAHYYHVFTAPGWESIVDEHLDMLESSDLMRHLPQLHLGIVGELYERAKVMERCMARMPVEVVATAEQGWEQVTLLQLYEDRWDYDAVLYTHTKGVTDPSTWNTEWRQHMEHTLIGGWTRNIELLAKHDAVGCHWLEPNKWPWRVDSPFFGGNFWWATSRTVNRAGMPKVNVRHEAEAWIGRVRNIKVYDLRPGWPGWGTGIRLYPGVPTCQISSFVPNPRATL